MGSIGSISFDLHCETNERFSARQEEREKQYQELLSALTEKFNVLSVIERDITEVKRVHYGRYKRNQ